jgi:SAM-dependent methyltransferase
VTEKLMRTATPETEDFYGKYEASGRIGQALVTRYFATVRMLVDRVTEAGIESALEIGCGPGYSTQRLRQMLPATVALDASDYVPALVEAARAMNPGIEIEQEDVYELRRREDSYDLVFLLEVLEHLDHPGAALAELRRVLKPDGWLILGVPREPIWRALNMARGKYLGAFGNTPGHLNHWSARSIRTYVSRHVGEVVATETPIPWTLALVRASR